MCVCVCVCVFVYFRHCLCVNSHRDTPAVVCQCERVFHIGTSHNEQKAFTIGILCVMQIVKYTVLICAIGVRKYGVLVCVYMVLCVCVCLCACLRYGMLLLVVKFVAHYSHCYDIVWPCNNLFVFIFHTAYISLHIFGLLTLVEHTF